MPADPNQSRSARRPGSVPRRPWWPTWPACRPPSWASCSASCPAAAWSRCGSVCSRPRLTRSPQPLAATTRPCQPTSVKATVSPSRRERRAHSRRGPVRSRVWAPGDAEGQLVVHPNGVALAAAISAGVRVAPGPKLPTRCGGWCSRSLRQATKQGGCHRVVPSCTRPSRGPAAGLVSNSVSNRVPVPSGRGRLRRSSPPRPGTGSAGRARQGRSRPDRPLLTVNDRWEPMFGHVGGTAGGDDVARSLSATVTSSTGGQGPSPVTTCSLVSACQGARQSAGL
jgi:hypothetical protein